MNFFKTGFGWTNGVILDLLAKYGHIASYKEPESATAYAEKYTKPPMTSSTTVAQTATTTPAALSISPITISTPTVAAKVTPPPQVREERTPKKVVEPIDETKTGRTEYELPPEKETESKMVDQEQRDFLAEQLKRKGSVMLSELLDEDDF